MFTGQCCQLQSWASFKSLTALRKFFGIRQSWRQTSRRIRRRKTFRRAGGWKAKCASLSSRCKIIQFFYLEWESKDHLLSSSGKYCVRELAAAWWSSISFLNENEHFFSRQTQTISQSRCAVQRAHTASVCNESIDSIQNCNSSIFHRIHT